MSPFNLCVVGMFVLFGWFAYRARVWAFVAGMIIYALDGFMFVIFGDYISFGFHIFVLYFVFRGYQAAKQLPNSYIPPKHKMSAQGGEKDVKSFRLTK